MREFLASLPLALYAIHVPAMDQSGNAKPQAGLLGIALIIGALLVALIWLAMQIQRSGDKNRDSDSDQ